MAKPTLRTLRAWRQARDISQAELAKQAGVTIETVSTIERAVTVPKLSVAQRLAHALQVSTDDVAWPTEETVIKPPSRTDRYRKLKEQVQGPEQEA